jgi:predicted metal-dependent peptidase
MQVSSPVKSHEKVLKARIALSLRQPFLSSAIMRLPIKDATAFSWCETMATDGYHIFYNSTWVETLTQSELRGVLAHEVLHVIFQHSSRKLHRDAIKWNIAADHAINLLLLEQGFKLPKGGFANYKFKEMSTEEIYTKLPNGVNFNPIVIRLTNESDTEETGVIPGLGCDLLDIDDARIRGAQESDIPDQSELRELCSELLVEAWGKLPGNSSSLFDIEYKAIREAKIDWRALLREWLQDRIKNEWSLWPYSKKYIHRGLLLPSIGIESPGHIIFTVDTSGSMDDNQLGEIFSELRAYRETFPCKLTVIQSDAAIQSITHYEEMDGEEIPLVNKVLGKGGTDFRPVFQWVNENAPKAYLIYATDGFGTFPDRVSSAGVIWLLTKPHIEESRVPFGACVSISN